MIYKLIAMFLAVAATCNAAGYERIFTFEQLAGDLDTTFLYAAVCDENYVYSQFYGGSSRSSGITRTDRNGVSTILTSSQQWLELSGGYTMNGIYNFSEYGDNLFIADTSSDQVYKINKYTGDINIIASVIDIHSALNYEYEKINMISPGVADSSGYYFSERESDNLFLAGSNGLNIAVTREEIVNLTGSSDLNGGLASDDAGGVYMYSNNGIYRWDTINNQGICLLSEGEILDYTSNTSMSIRDLFYAPDGNLYFYDYYFGILSINLATDGSLETILTKSELVDGPAGSSNIFGFSWYDDNLAFTQMTSGYYAVPEPATMSMLAIGALAVCRRKTR